MQLRGWYSAACRHYIYAGTLGCAKALSSNRTGFVDRIFSVTYHRKLLCCTTVSAIIVTSCEPVVTMPTYMMSAMTVEKQRVVKTGAAKLDCSMAETEACAGTLHLWDQSWWPHHTQIWKLWLCRRLWQHLPHCQRDPGKSANKSWSDLTWPPTCLPAKTVSMAGCCRWAEENHYT